MDTDTDTDTMIDSLERRAKQNDTMEMWLIVWIWPVVEWSGMVWAEYVIPTK